jgi:transposase
MQAPTCYLGIDISKDRLDACRRANGPEQRRRFPNTSAGHRQLIDWLGGGLARACVEASGRYGLDIALALSEAEDIQVMVASPRAVKNFREASMRRSKTDALDASVLCEYA